MKVYRFREEGTGRIAITRDAAGKALPRTGREWHAIGSAEVDRREPTEFGATAVEISEQLLRTGIFFYTGPA